MPSWTCAPLPVARRVSSSKWFRRCPTRACWNPRATSSPTMPIPSVRTCWFTSSVESILRQSLFLPSRPRYSPISSRRRPPPTLVWRECSTECFAMCPVPVMERLGRIQACGSSGPTSVLSPSILFSFVSPSTDAASQRWVGTCATVLAL